MLLALAGCNKSNSTEVEKSELHNCISIERRIDSNLADKIDTIIDDAAGRGFAGGITIMDDGKIIYDRIVGNASLTEEIPITHDTLFHVASITKYFTAAMVINAADENALSLSDPIVTHLPEMKVAAQNATIADLLSHRSGLTSSYVAEQASTHVEAITGIDNIPIDAQRAGEFNYANDGYDLLGIILERVYGRSYEEVLKEKLLSPACLTRPRHWGLVKLDDPSVVAQPLQSFPEALTNRNYGMLSSAGLLITAEDLAAYQWALSNDRILSPKSKELLFSPQVERQDDFASFGGFLSEHAILGTRLSARGYEDWGDNAIMNHYLDRSVIVTVVTSRGPALDNGARPFRSEISGAIEELLANGIN